MKSLWPEVMTFFVASLVDLGELVGIGEIARSIQAPMPGHSFSRYPLLHGRPVPVISPTTRLQHRKLSQPVIVSHFGEPAVFCGVLFFK